MKQPWIVSVLAALLSVGACGSSMHPRQGARSRQVCEELVVHSFKLEHDAATLFLDDHRYQRAKIEADLAQRQRDVLASPKLLSFCNELTDREFACMSGAKDWFTYQSCYEAKPTPVPPSQPTQQEAPAPSQAPAEPLDPPCPELEGSAGVGTATVSGVVRINGEPAAGIIVAISQPDGRGYSTITEEAGRYSMDGIAPGRYYVMAVNGFNRSLRPCTPVRGGDRLTFDFDVADDPPPPTEIIELR